MYTNIFIYKIFTNMIHKNKKKYLDIYLQWNKKKAIDIAKKELISMNKNHWEIIFLLRKFYKEFNFTPNIRMFINFARKILKTEKINSIYLFKLFPKGPIHQGSKISGIPKPSRCL
ncbi:Sulfurtransferase TusE [Buchnera aphidicola (Neophyllaphis podocarpi)]